MEIAIIGSGYVGLVTGATLTYLGHTVTFLDIDQKKIDQLRRGESPIYQPGLEELLQSNRIRIHETADPSDALPGAQVVFIIAGTPLSPNGSPGMQYVQQWAKEIGAHLNGKYKLVVNKSTVPIGSGNWVEAIIPDSHETRHGPSADRLFSVASNPEFLKEETALRDTFYPDRIVVGSQDPRAVACLSELYRPLLKQDFIAPSMLPRPENFVAVPLVTTDLASAEMIKYASNAFLTVKISFINEMSGLAERVGADVTLVARGIGLDSRIASRFLHAGIGWGGSCFGKDTAALAAMGLEYGAPLHLVEAARTVNCVQRECAVETLQNDLKIIKGPTIGSPGVAFKPNTDNIRDSRALDIRETTDSPQRQSCSARPNCNGAGPNQGAWLRNCFQEQPGGRVQRGGCRRARYRVGAVQEPELPRAEIFHAKPCISRRQEFSRSGGAAVTGLSILCGRPQRLAAQSQSRDSTSVRISPSSMRRSDHVGRRRGGSQAGYC
jgi:UDPglucose 6-dehydrogenase